MNGAAKKIKNELSTIDETKREDFEESKIKLW